MEVVSGSISAELRSLIYHSTFSANAMQLLLNYGTLIASATSLALLLLMCFYKPAEKMSVAANIGTSTSLSAPLDDEKPYLAEKKSVAANIGTSAALSSEPLNVEKPYLALVGSEVKGDWENSSLAVHNTNNMKGSGDSETVFENEK